MKNKKNNPKHKNHIKSILVMNSIIKASLEWINSQSEFDHPNDENREKCASRAISKNAQNLI